MKIPNCVGVIMDGNRRWAKSKGLPTFQGHAEGYENLKTFLKWAKNAGVRHVVAYALSLENWKRSEDEVSFLLSLIRRIFTEETEVFLKEEVSVRFAGKLSLFPKDMVREMHTLEEKTKHFTERTLTLAVSYGGRDDIVNAVNTLIQEGKSEITEEDISAHLYTGDMPDPDLVIRTSGEMRVSGFLPWQTVYSELFFTKTYWPDFSEEEFNAILAEYDARDRRMGK